MDDGNIDLLLNKALVEPDQGRAEAAGLWYVRSCIIVKASARLSEAALNRSLPQKIRDAAAVGYVGVCAANAYTHSTSLDNLLEIAAGESRITRRPVVSAGPSSDVIERIKKAAASEYVKICIIKRLFGLLQTVIFDNEGSVFSRSDRMATIEAFKAAGKTYSESPSPFPAQWKVPSNSPRERTTRFSGAVRTCS